MMSVEQPVYCLAEETEVLGENQFQYRFAHQKSHPGIEPEPLWWEPND
jgi:hypothetical protein